MAVDFEADAGWQAGAPGDGATSGKWVRAIPVGTVAQPATDHTEAGSACYVTGNGTAGAPAGEADVDGGATTLLSPVWDLRGASGARISYWRWFSNDQGTFPDEDVWSVDVSNDGGVGRIAAVIVEGVDAIEVDAIKAGGDDADKPHDVGHGIDHGCVPLTVLCVGHLYAPARVNSSARWQLTQ